MRFNEIKRFHVNKLFLDEENYRFAKAGDQEECIEKIHNSNPSAFSRLMESIAEDDLGEPILVFVNEQDEAIVADGNRRTSVIKVLHDPDLAPTLAIKRKAIALRAKTNFDFTKIQAQTSNDLPTIQRTLIERHSSKGGTRRIPWSSLAASRFEYDTGMFEGGHYWQATALIYKTEEIKVDYADYISSKDYSHETFTRIIRAAINSGVITSNIFLEKDKRLKQKVKKELLDDTLNKCCIFLDSMKSKEISLSRGENFADKANLEKYISKFKKSPDWASSRGDTTPVPNVIDPKPQGHTNELTDNPTSNSNSSSDSHWDAPSPSESPQQRPTKGGKTNGTATPRSKNNPDTRKYLFPSNFTPKIYDDIFNRIFKEIKRLELSNNTDYSLSVAVLLRVFLEKIYLDYRAKVQKINRNPPKTHEVMKDICKHINSNTLTKEQNSALRYFNKTANNTSYVLSPDTLGAFAHGAHIPDSKQLKREWDNVQAIIEYMIEKIQ